MKNQFLMLFIALFCFGVFAIDADAQTLGPQRSLRKLSRKLRMGVEPSISDQNQLADIVKEFGPQSTEVDQFLASKAKEYTQSSEFNQKLQYHLQTLFRFTSFVKDENGAPLVTKSPEGTDDPSLFIYNMSDAINASTYSIFTSLIKNNLSWDYLLTGKDYIINNNVYFRDPKKTNYIQENSFFSAVQPDAIVDTTTDGKSVPPNGNGPLVTKFKEDDSRLAGVLTSTQFRARYHAGPSNENRRLSQAVFRIFLCDNLQPAFIPVASEDADNVLILKKILQKLQEPGSTLSETQVMNMMNANAIKHGTEASCMSCHSKLDPLASAFGPFGNTQLGAQPYSGAIHFKRSSTETVHIEGAGLGDLAKSMTTLPEYLQCQTENFWKWFIGAEVPLNDKRKIELSDLFSGKKSFAGQKIDRRPKEFVQMLVSQPEFRLDVARLDPYSPEMMKSLVQSCNKCHTSNDVITLSQRPYGGSAQEDARFISELRRRVIDLDPAHADSMPPNRATWSEGDLNKLKTWILRLKPFEETANGGQE